MYMRIHHNYVDMWMSPTSSPVSGLMASSSCRGNRGIDWLTQNSCTWETNKQTNKQTSVQTNTQTMTSTYLCMKLSKNHNFLNMNVALMLLYESPGAQDTFGPITRPHQLCWDDSGSVGATWHAHVTDGWPHDERRSMVAWWKSARPCCTLTVVFRVASAQQ